MKKFHLFILMFLVLAACKENSVDSTVTQPTPIVLTKDADSVTATKAILVGEITGNAFATFEYGTNTSYGNTINAIPNYVSGKATVKATIVGLTPGTSYHFRARASNPAFVNGNDMTFVTNSLQVGDTYKDGVVISVDQSGHGKYIKKISKDMTWFEAKTTADSLGGELPTVEQLLQLYPNKVKFGLDKEVYWSSEEATNPTTIVKSVVFNSITQPEFNGKVVISLKTMINSVLVVCSF